MDALKVHQQRMPQRRGGYSEAAHPPEEQNTETALRVPMQKDTSWPIWGVYFYIFLHLPKLPNFFKGRRNYTEEFLRSTEVKACGLFITLSEMLLFQRC